MKRRSALVSTIAVLALALGGCSSSGDDESSDEAGAEQSDSASGGSDTSGDSDSGDAASGEGSSGEESGDSGSSSDGGSASGGSGSAGSGSSGGSEGGNGSANGQSIGGTTTDIDPDAGTNNPTATIEWAGKKQSFLLIVCDDQGPSSLSASGDDLNAGSILTLSVRNGSGQLLVEADATLEEEFYGEIDRFSSSGSTFDGSGSFEADDETGDFTLRGDCKDL